MIERPIVCSCDCWLVKSPWLLPIKTRRNEPDARSHHASGFDDVAGRQEPLHAKPRQRAGERQEGHRRRATDENHWALRPHRQDASPWWHYHLRDFISD